MKENELRERVYKLVVKLREKGMSYDEIEVFWRKCIDKAKPKQAFLLL